MVQRGTVLNVQSEYREPTTLSAPMVTPKEDERAPAHSTTVKVITTGRSDDDSPISSAFIST